MSFIGELFVGGVTLLTSIRDGFGRKGKLTTTYLRDGTKFLRRAGSFDRFVIWEVWGLHDYDKGGFRIKPEDIVVDIGAQIGAFSVYAAKKAKKGKIFAYEPFSENYKILLANKKLNKTSNLKPFKLAISGKAGSVDFYSSASNSAAHSLIKFQKDHVKAEDRVRTIPLKEVFLNNKIGKVDFLKIDAEGSEYEILFKTPKKFLNKIGKIVMEFHRPPGFKYSPEDIRIFL